ncbi:MAG TPA: hypothetical protein VFP93_05065, partial [Gammaproteobacteria bacterium]|nr:hypothetical protein [Gammaproteobacteria bacterium]
PNLRHETLVLLPVERILLQYLDGKRKISKINRILEEKVLNKELNLTDEQNNPIVEKKQIHERIQKLTLSTLENLARKAYLLA